MVGWSVVVGGGLWLVCGWSVCGGRWWSVVGLWLVVVVVVVVGGRESAQK